MLKVGLQREKQDGLARYYPGVLGVFLGVALLKLGNPIILDHLVVRPANWAEVVFATWPPSWGYGLLGMVAVLGLFAVRGQVPKPRWLFLLPLVWLAWQVLAGFGSVDRRLSGLTLPHFAATVGCFYLAAFTLGRGRGIPWFWWGVLVGFVWMLLAGFEQHYGGLDAVRQQVDAQGGWESLRPEYRERLRSNRIFATLLYPNTLAGVLLLWGPVLGVATWLGTARWPRIARGVLTGAVVWCALACLYWSGSKAGWLIALGLAMVVVLRLPFQRRLKVGLVLVVLTGGLLGFFVRYATYFTEKKAASVGARFDYWQAAWATFLRHPLLGAGPGTFKVTYRDLKRPESEMTLLAHNDYLQQASDSGLPGFLAYAGFLVGSLWWLRTRRSLGAIQFSAWLGLLGWGLQSAVEFGLYIPAVSWSAFSLLGWMWGLPEARERCGNGFDTRAGAQ